MVNVRMRTWVFIAVTIVSIIIAGCSKPTDPSKAVVIYKSPTCGCCGFYASYLEQNGWGVDVNEMQNLAPIKQKYGVPETMLSCHTTVVGGYFVEGHVPTEAIEKLLAEKPDIAGIAIPEMPSGSPGMPGPKKQPFLVYAVTKDGKTQEFMRI